MRERFHRLLASVAPHCRLYYNPPENFKMEYPAVVYNLSKIKKKRASNISYLSNKQYEVTLITKDPEDQAIDGLANITMAEFERHFESDLLHHYVFNIYE